MSAQSNQSAQDKPKRPSPVVTIWLFKNHLKLRANPTITYRCLFVIFVVAFALLTEANPSSQVVEWIRHVLTLLGQ